MEALFGGAIVVLVLILAARTVLARAGRPLALGVTATPRARAGIMAVLSVIAALVVFPTFVPAARRGIFSFCGVCPMGTVATGGPESLLGFMKVFLLAVCYYSATVLPVFVLACLLSGVMIARPQRYRVRGVLPAFGLAAVLPVCSCGVIPIGKAMIERGGNSARDGLVFIAAAPLLSPIVMSLAFTLLGWRYLVLRVVGSLMLAVTVALFVRPFVSAPTGTPSTDAACATTPGAGGSILLTGWNMLTRLTRYVLFGIVLGSLFTAALPPDYVGTILQSGFASMAAVVVIGVPINMCAGEEILLSAPLSGMGLTMGHALAFALASTGICVSSVPLLLNLLGRRGTLIMIAVYLVVPFLLGIVVNALPQLGTLGPAQF